MPITTLDRPAPADILADITRREFVTGGLAALLLASCGSGTRTEDAAQDGNGAFPVTIEHIHGSTTIPARPERVVTIGLIEQDALLAMGVAPVGTTNWIGEHPGAIHPWALQALGNAAVPEVLSNESIPFERIAVLKPDLIVGLYNVEVTEGDYERLTQIAPTVLSPPGLRLGTTTSITWQDLTRIVGRAVGESRRADELVKEVEDKFAAVRAMHPGFASNTAINAYPTPDGGYQLYPPPDLGGQLLSGLGFQTPPKILELAKGNPSLDLGAEQVELMEADVVVWLVEDPAREQRLRADPLYATLAVAKEGRDVFLDYESDPLADAASMQTVLSLPFLIDGLLPQLVAALDGDPATQAAL